jgi:hypothetical protein
VNYYFRASFRVKPFYSGGSGCLDSFPKELSVTLHS